MTNRLTLDNIIADYMSQWDVPESRQRTIEAIAVRGYKQFYMHVSGEPQTVQLEILSNKTAVLPCDCQNYNVIGILNPMGEIASFTEDQNLGLVNESFNDRDTTFTETLALQPDNNIFYNADGARLTPFIYQQFGTGARSDLAFFRVDWKTETVVFNYNMPYDEVYIEYLPIPKDDGEYVVNHYFQEGIISFIGWKDTRRSQTDRAEEKGNFWNELRIGKRSIAPSIAQQSTLQFARTTRLARF